MKVNLYSRRALDVVVRICGSNTFLWFVIGFFIIEASWVAVTFRFPMLFDEQYHLGVIGFFAHHVSPITLHQSIQYDVYGNLAYSSASIYHYILSFPYRIIVHFTDSIQAQVISLRLLNVLFAASGLWIFSRLFQEIGVKKPLANLTLFFYSIIPMFIFVAATISYDNILLPLTAYFFLIGARIVKSNKKVSTSDYIKFLTVGLLASLIKFSFLPLFIAGVIYMIVRGYRAQQGQFFTDLMKGVTSQTPKFYALLAFSFVILGLFTARYTYPVIVYKNPFPDCSQVISYDRCLKNGVYFAKEQAVKTKSTRPTIPIQSYAQWWVASMTSQFDISAANTGSKIKFGRDLPIISSFMTISIFAGVTILLYMWQSLNKPKSWNFIIVTTITYLVFLFIFNSLAFYSANTDLNTQARYSLSIMPTVMAMAIVAINRVMGRSATLKLASLILVLIICTQGAGDIKHIVTSSNDWYWQNNVFIEHTNDRLRNILDPAVKG